MSDHRAEYKKSLLNLYKQKPSMLETANAIVANVKKYNLENYVFTTSWDDGLNEDPDCTLLFEGVVGGGFTYPQ